jgi:hypothetical protein
LDVDAVLAPEGNGRNNSAVISRAWIRRLANQQPKSAT